MPELEKDLKAFEAQRGALLQQHAGKFALFHDGKLAEVFESEMDAISCGYKTFGIKPFMVKQIVPVDREITLSSALIGL